MQRPTADSFLDEAVGLIQELGTNPEAMEADRRARTVAVVFGSIALELRNVSSGIEKLNGNLEELMKRNNLTIRQK